MRLGIQNDRALVQFEEGPWHGTWKMHNGEVHVWWHWTGDRTQVGTLPKIYNIIAGATRYLRGSDGWVEVLSPLHIA